MEIDLTKLPEDLRPKAEELSKYIDFKFHNEKGGNGHVLIGYNTLLKRDVVIKFYYWGDGDHPEPSLLANLESDYVLKVHHAESINKDDALFMTQYCDSGDLDDCLALRRFGTIEAIDVLIQIASGVSYLHGNGFLHRDLKPANVFCKSHNQFVIGDFGSVVGMNDDGYAKTQTRHSLLYRPPEELAERCFYREGDIYQLGIVLYQILGGFLPYEESAWLTTKQLTEYTKLSGWDQQSFATEIIEKKILKGQLLDLSTLPPWTPLTLRSIVRQCSRVRREARFPSAADLVACLNNIRGRIPDWKIVEHPTLDRGSKQYRIIPRKEAFIIEKCVGTQWRRERSYSPASLEEAVQIAEGL